jgi:uncharacterized membrane protein HdeD (DUF308 family)
MTATNILFVVLGTLSALSGAALLVAALRGTPGQSKRSTAQLIAGMMALAFGLVLAAFAIAYATTEPYEFNEVAPA